MRAYIQENFLYMEPEVELVDADDFLALGIVDSLGFVELVEEVQSRFGMVIEDVEITEENFGSIDAIAGFVERKRTSA
jgi:acyl carrier protein